MIDIQPLFIPLGEAPLHALTRTELDWVPLDQLTSDHTEGRVVVVVALDEPIAEAQGWELVGRGVSADRVRIRVLDRLTGHMGPVKDLFWRDVQPLRKAPAADSFPTLPSGIGMLDKNLGWRWRMRELGIVAGPYSSGKSTILQQLAFNFVRTNREAIGDTGALLCAWEDEASDMRKNLGRFIVRNGREHGRDYDYLFDKIHYVCRDPNEERLVGWYIDLVKFHHRRYGTRFFTLDPWNELDHKRDGKQMETEYVRDAMRTFRQLVDSLGIILLIATHVPAKMIRGDGAIEPFKIAHSFGSGNFGNKADRGLCVVRTKKFEPSIGHTIMRLDKSKIEEKMGRKGTVAGRLDIQNFELEYDAYATEQVKDVWKD